MEYTNEQRAIIFGAYTVLNNAQATADHFRDLYGWSLGRSTVSRIVDT